MTDEMCEEALRPPEEFDFPFPPYPIQHEFMTKLYQVLTEKKLGIFESPTGTGKSLSIICGAIRWLKDHNRRQKDALNQKIEWCEREKEKCASNSSDWLAAQSEEIKITQQLNLLKLQRSKIEEYEGKMEKLKNNQRKQREDTKVWAKIPKETNSKTDDILEGEENLDDEDMLLGGDLPSELDASSDEEEEERYKPLKIYICSRTHSQLSQFVGEITKSPFGRDVRAVSLASRQSYCINPDVRKLNSMALINERCMDIQRKPAGKVQQDEDGKVTKKSKANRGKCPFYKQQHVNELRAMALVEVMDVEDLVRSGKTLKACPYYASRKAAEDAEVILIPYNTLLHKATREANGIQLKGNVVIIDEAHNLLEALAQMHNADLSYKQIEYALQQLMCYKARFSTRFSAPNLLNINQLVFILKKLQKFLDKDIKQSAETQTSIFTIGGFVSSTEVDNFNMFKILKFCKDMKIAQKVRNFSVKYPIEEEAKKAPKKGVKDFLASIENKKNVVSTSDQSEMIERKQTIPSNPLLSVISFLECLTYSYEDGRVLVHKNKDRSLCKLQFLLLNAATQFADVVQEARSIIVAGGTMKPNEEFRNRLFVNAGASTDRIVEFSCDHIIPPENILPIVVTKGQNDENLLFNFENRFKMGDVIRSILHQACRTVRGGIVVFFPSYKYENWVWQQVEKYNFGRPVFREPQDAGSVEGVLTKYAETIRRFPKTGALLFSVVGGKLSEGLNFSDDLGRCVVVIGLPYANIKAVDLKEKMAYLDKLEGFGSGHKFYENICMKAVNQCIGRAVRHRNDYAVVLLLDERYNRSATKNALPGWIKRSLQVGNYKETFVMVEKFFKEKITEEVRN